MNVMGADLRTSTPSMTPMMKEGVRIAALERAKLRATARRERIIVLALQALVLIVTLVAWEYAPEQGLFDPFYISRPSLVVGALMDWSANGTLLRNTLLTLLTTLYGFGIGSLIGFVVGLLLSTSKWLGRVLTPFVSALQSVPRLALVPLFILWFGIGMTSKIALVSTVVFFLVFAATRAGVAAVDESLANTLRIMRASHMQVHMFATLPSAMVWIIEGLRISIPWALVATVTTEILSSNAGLGFLISRSAGQFYTAGVFAGITVLTILGVLLTVVVTVVETHVLKWRQAASH